MYSHKHRILNTIFKFSDVLMAIHRLPEESMHIGFWMGLQFRELGDRGANDLDRKSGSRFEAVFFRLLSRHRFFFLLQMLQAILEDAGNILYNVDGFQLQVY